MERIVNLNGSNGLMGEYNIKSINLDKEKGTLSVGCIYAPYIIIQNIVITKTSFLKEQYEREVIYKKRKNIVDKLLDEFF